MAKKGIPQTSEHRRKISEALKGHPMYKSLERSAKLSASLKGKKVPSRYTPERNKKISESLKGRIASPETKERLRQSHLGKKQSPTTIQKRRESRAGYRHSLETRIKMKNSSRKGNSNHSWKGGITDVNEAIRRSFEYRLWRESVFKRDDFSYVFCGQRGGRLNADHIKPFADYPELRFAIDNGRTLCEPCHKTTETYGRKNRPLKK